MQLARAHTHPKPHTQPHLELQMTPGQLTVRRAACLGLASAAGAGAGQKAANCFRRSLPQPFGGWLVCARDAVPAHSGFVATRQRKVIRIKKRARPQLHLGVGLEICAVDAHCGAVEAAHLVSASAARFCMLCQRPKRRSLVFCFPGAHHVAARHVGPGTSPPGDAIEERIADVGAGQFTIFIKGEEWFKVGVVFAHVGSGCAHKSGHARILLGDEY